MSTNCINRNHPEYRRLKSLTGLNDWMLSSKLSNWFNKFNDWPSPEDLTNFVIESPRFLKRVNDMFIESNRVIIANKIKQWYEQESELSEPLTIPELGYIDYNGDEFVINGILTYPLNTSYLQLAEVLSMNSSNPKYKSDYLNEIINNNPLEYNRFLAELFLNRIEFVKDNIVEILPTDEQIGEYVPDSETIRLSYDNAATYLHEFAHNLTYYLFTDRNRLSDRDRRYLESILRDFYKARGERLTNKELSRFYAEYEYGQFVTPHETGLYGLSDPAEFISESLTNPAFQSYLNSIVTPRRTTLLSDIYIKLVNYLKSTINEITFNRYSLLTRVLDTTIKFIAERENDSIPTSGQYKPANRYNPEVVNTLANQLGIEFFLNENYFEGNKLVGSTIYIDKSRNYPDGDYTSAILMGLLTKSIENNSIIKSYGKDLFFNPKPLVDSNKLKEFYKQVELITGVSGLYEYAQEYYYSNTKFEIQEVESNDLISNTITDSQIGLTTLPRDNNPQYMEMFNDFMQQLELPIKNGDIAIQEQDIFYKSGFVKSMTNNDVLDIKPFDLIPLIQDVLNITNEEAIVYMKNKVANINLATPILQQMSLNNYNIEGLDSISPSQLVDLEAFKERCV